jgi:hypothetical protein
MINESFICTNHIEIKKTISPSEKLKTNQNLNTMSSTGSSTSGTLTPASLGTPDFKIVDITPSEVASALQEYLNRGSRLTGVSLDDIKTALPKAVTDPKRATLVDLLNAGMKIFDALVWLSAGRPSTHPLTVDSGAKVTDITSMHDIARAVFYNYFFIVTQARYPVKAGDVAQPKTPNFLSVILGMKEDQGVYVERVCSFEPEKFDKSWAQYVQFKGFGQEAISRFGLGVAGYRLFGPFKLYAPEKAYPENLKSAVEFATKIAKSAPTWDIHPATRRAEILTKRGNLNKNLTNLILDVFTDEQIEEMVKTRVLFKLPVREAGARNYLQWTAEDDISGTTLIFQA